ncbi:E3 ubiquitin-protein ligase Praja-1 [Porphyridium purpureum]|uniref:E3 ubiquitin-protein ligase Praja-1 n=1 Tax=Porphyridium purpureum TaxID=35688 RepID=A0A5J4YNY3_PORPP|nr:E3 ubiquitin-protein ligase Praja-1 [Porphyridium purpureum]|eukprot:POR3446..scf296_7
MWLEISLIVAIVTFSVLYGKLACHEVDEEAARAALYGFFESTHHSRIFMSPCQECTGLSRKKIDMIPLVRVQDDELELGRECIICKDGYKAGEAVRVLRCKHQYHRECVDYWLDKSVFCPLCRCEAL